VAEELYQTLLRFHREIAVPDMERTIREPLQREIRDLRDEMHTDSDALWKQMETLNQEYQAIKAGLKRLEEQMAARAELERLKERVVILEHRVDDLIAKH
jgi:predicted nuclease with TOPRIM domain